MCVCVLRGGGGGGGRTYEHQSHHISYTRHTVTTSSTEPYSLMKIAIFLIESIAALTITVKYLIYSKLFSSYGADIKLHLKPSRGNNSVCKREMSFL